MIPGQDRHSWQKQVARSDLPSVARLIGHTIAISTDPTGGQGVWVSASDLARLTGLSENCVRRYLRVLYRAGWLHGGGGDARAGQQPRFLSFPGELRFGDVAEVGR